MSSVSLTLRTLTTDHRLTSTMARTATIQRKTAETEIELELNLDGTGQAQIATGRRLPRPHAHAAGQARGDRSDGQGRRRPGRRSAPHGRGRRHLPGPGAARGAGRQGGHPPLRPLHAADGRDARHRGRRPRRPGLLRLPGRVSHAPRSASSTANWWPTSGRPSRPTPCATCTSSCTTAATATTSPKASSRPRPGRCGWPSSPTRGCTGVPSTKGTL